MGTIGFLSFVLIALAGQQKAVATYHIDIPNSACWIEEYSGATFGVPEQTTSGGWSRVSTERIVCPTSLESGTNVIPEDLPAVQETREVMMPLQDDYPVQWQKENCARAGKYSEAYKGKWTDKGCLLSGTDWTCADKHNYKLESTEDGKKRWCHRAPEVAK